MKKVCREKNDNFKKMQTIWEHKPNLILIVESIKIIVKLLANASQCFFYRNKSCENKRFQSLILNGINYVMNLNLCVFFIRCGFVVDLRFSKSHNLMCHEMFTHKKSAHEWFFKKNDWLLSHWHEKCIILTKIPRCTINHGAHSWHSQKWANTFVRRTENTWKSHSW